MLLVSGTAAATAAITRSAPPIPFCSPEYLALAIARSAGYQPRHTAAEALATLAKADPTRDQQIGVVLTRMADPYAAKLGLGSASQLRLLWIIYGSEAIKSRPPGRMGPPATYPVGTVLPVFWMIDDTTLKFGGAYECSGPAPR